MALIYVNTLIRKYQLLSHESYVFLCQRAENINIRKTKNVNKFVSFNKNLWSSSILAFQFGAAFSVYNIHCLYIIYMMKIMDKNSNENNTVTNVPGDRHHDCFPAKKKRDILWQPQHEQACMWRGGKKIFCYVFLLHFLLFSFNTYIQFDIACT